MYTLISGFKSRSRPVFETVVLLCHCPEKPIGMMPSTVLSHLPWGAAERSIWKVSVGLLVNRPSEIPQKLFLYIQKEIFSHFIAF